MRTYQEVDVSPVSPSSTTGCEEKRSETNHWRRTTQRTRNESCGCLLKWTSFLLFRTQLHRMRDIALRNGPLDRNAGRNVQRSADVSGNARHFCDCELNYKNLSLINPSSTTGSKQSTNITHRHLVWRIHTQNIESRKINEY